MKQTPIKNIDTPALLLDIDKLENNIKSIITFAKDNHLNYRPHIKTHKSINLAKMQIDLGAIGITVATVGEAEVMAHGGIKDILIAYPIATKMKLERIEKIMDLAKITIAVDSIAQINLLQNYFESKQKVMNVWIKINSGLNRCGVEPDEVKALGETIKEAKNLTLNGIFTHAGHSYAASTDAEIEAIAKKEADVVLKSAEICESIDLPIKHKSIGSTPTYKRAGQVNGITEIRPGNAVFFDMIQVGLNVASIETCALTVLSAVGSKHKDRLVIDAGSKTLNLDKGAHGNESVKGHGYIIEHPELTIDRLSEEHGIITTTQENDIKITDKITIIPNHACTVVNLFDEYLICKEDQVIDKWPVDARGRVK